MTKREITMAKNILMGVGQSYKSIRREGRSYGIEFTDPRTGITVCDWTVERINERIAEAQIDYSNLH